MVGLEDEASYNHFPLEALSNYQAGLVISTYSPFDSSLEELEVKVRSLTSELPHCCAVNSSGFFYTTDPLDYLSHDLLGLVSINYYLGKVNSSCQVANHNFSRQGVDYHLTLRPITGYQVLTIELGTGTAYCLVTESESLPKVKWQPNYLYLSDQPLAQLLPEVLSLVSLPLTGISFDELPVGSLPTIETDFYLTYYLVVSLYQQLMRESEDAISYCLSWSGQPYLKPTSHWFN